MGKKKTKFRYTVKNDTIKNTFSMSVWKTGTFYKYKYENRLQLANKRLKI